MSDAAATELGHRLLRCFNENAVPDVFTDDALLWNNVTGVAQPWRAAVEIAKLLHTAVPDLGYEDVVVHGWPTGFAVQYTITATLPDGAGARAAACGVGTIEAGAVVRFDEYVNAAHLAPLFAALTSTTAPA